jgi:hypothetical protein
MSTHSIDDEILDDDPTDELPVLTEVMRAGLEQAASTHAVSGDLDDTGQFDTSRLRALRAAEMAEGEAAALQRDLEAREAELEQLRGELQARERDIAALRRELDDERNRTRALEQDARALETQITALETGEAGAGEDARQWLVDRTVARLRDEIAALSHHIENRNAIWREQAAAVEAQSTRIRELELELSQRRQRQQVAEQHAEDEAARARQAREKLAAMSATLEQARGRLAAGTGLSKAAAAERAAQLRAELEDSVALQAELGEDPQALERLQALEAELQSLEREMENSSAPLRLPSGPAQLICLTDPEVGTRVLDAPTVTIGRAGDCDIRIMTHYVSREHARVTCTAAECVIEDLGSRNGVFVNSVKVDRQALEANDIVTVGDTQFRYLPAAAVG